HDVAVAGAKRACGDGVRGGARGPETEPVVMFGGEDHRARAATARGAGPLTRVERGGREDRRILASVAPLAIGERVHAEVEKERELVTLPGELSRRGSRARRCRARATPARSRRKRAC